MSAALAAVAARREANTALVRGLLARDGLAVREEDIGPVYAGWWLRVHGQDQGAVRRHGENALAGRGWRLLPRPGCRFILLTIGEA